MPWQPIEFEVRWHFSIQIEGQFAKTAIFQKLNARKRRTQVNLEMFPNTRLLHGFA